MLLDDSTLNSTIEGLAQDSRAVDVFASIDMLFPWSKDNVVDLCELRWRRRDRFGRRRTEILLERGSVIQDEHFVLRPLDDLRSYVGSQLGHSITSQINQDYWLIAFWERLLENAKHSALAREVVRAFVLQCGLVILETLYAQKRVVDHTFVASQGIMDIGAFYERVFNWSQIFRLMRAGHRKTLRERVSRNNKYKRLHRTEDLDVVGVLPTINRVLAESGLPELVQAPQIGNARGIVITLSMMSFTWWKARKLRRGLFRAIIGPMMT